MTIQQYFRLDEHGTTVRTEVLAGVTTFLTMAYIIFLQPAVLSGALFGIETGMDFRAVTVATCLSAALATAIMALYARYPIAQAPGMGENFFFVFTVLPAAAALPAVVAGTVQAWQVALGVVFVSGVFFLILSLLRVRELIVNALSPSLKNGIAVGIGLFIAFIGLQNAAIVVKDPGTAVKLNSHFLSPDHLIFFVGLITMSALHVRRVRGSILIGIVATTGLSVALHVVFSRGHVAITELAAIKDSMLMTRFKMPGELLAWGSYVSSPPSVKPTFLACFKGLPYAFSSSILPFIVIGLFMDMFDTIGTLIGVSEQAGFIKDNKLPRARQALLSDAIGTVAGACLGTSTVTSFIESTAGVEQGGRTGLTGLTTAALFLLAIFVSPVIEMVGSYPPITAPALILVGAMMIQNVRKIEWEDYSESIPAFLTLIGIPLTYSIADGLAFGFISYPLVKLLGGRGRQVSWLMYLLGGVLLVYFLGVRARV